MTTPPSASATGPAESTHTWQPEAKDPATRSVMALIARAGLYTPAMKNSYAMHESIAEARRRMGKYDLEPTELGEAAPLLAKCIVMLEEENGGIRLGPDRLRDLELGVLAWCRVDRAGGPVTDSSAPP